VDNLARFVSPDTIICAVDEDSSRPHHRKLKDNRRRLTLARRPYGRRYRILPLPLPSPLGTGLGDLPASYLNFYIANRWVLVPAFGCPQDETARMTLQNLFPRRRAISLNCRDLIRGLGGIHCVTLQQPRVVRC
jgi:agmatine deiminase